MKKIELKTRHLHHCGKWKRRREIVCPMRVINQESIKKERSDGDNSAFCKIIGCKPTVDDAVGIADMLLTIYRYSIWTGLTTWKKFYIINSNKFTVIISIK